MANRNCLEINQNYMCDIRLRIYPNPDSYIHPALLVLMEVIYQKKHKINWYIPSR